MSCMQLPQVSYERLSYALKSHYAVHTFTTQSDRIVELNEKTFFSRDVSAEVVGRIIFFFLHARSEPQILIAHRDQHANWPPNDAAIQPARAPHCQQKVYATDFILNAKRVHRRADCESAHTHTQHTLHACGSNTKQTPKGQFLRKFSAHYKCECRECAARVDCIYGNAAALTGTQISEQVHTMKLDLSVAEQTMLLFSCLGIKKSDVTGREVDFSFILWFVISFMGVLFSPEVARPTLQTYI